MFLLLSLFLSFPAHIIHLLHLSLQKLFIFFLFLTIYELFILETLIFFIFFLFSPHRRIAASPHRRKPKPTKVHHASQVRPNNQFYGQGFMLQGFSCQVLGFQGFSFLGFMVQGFNLTKLLNIVWFARGLKRNQQPTMADRVSRKRKAQR